MIHPLAAARGVPRRTWLRWRFAYLVLLPTLVLFTYLRVFPTAWAFVMSFFEWGLVKPAEKFVGLDNYTQLLSDKNFTTALLNTTIFAFATTIFSVVLAIALAAVLARVVRGRTGGLIELLYFAPVLVPMVPVTLGWREIFNYNHGVLNAFLGIFGITRVPWLSDPNMALVAVIILSVWKQVGYNMIILIVGMRAIPRVYDEAAAVDGANAWQRFRHVTMPLLAPVTLFVIVITTIASYNVFTQVYVLASDVQGAPGRLVPVIVYDLFQNGFRYFKMGYASAEAVYLFLIILVLTLIQFRFLRGARA
ncbi:MAG TPA: sugar ABC transporter permease [Candidatus Limnocylindrales bacterium]|nr:sugar ABC transporter permease [Candidatus Limnocylindrales bacterium]